jgi:pimeloyl-ACP methyl ester carboxylesterase
MRAADSPLAFKAYYVGMKAAATFSIPLAGWFANKIWFTPWRVTPSERGLRRQAEWLSDTRPIRLSTRYGQIAGIEAGAGPTVLLVHGWGERAASLGALITPLTSAGYRVVGIDMPGHGDSAHITAQPNLYVAAETIQDVADQLGGVSAVIGHSVGGHSTMMALKNGLQVDSVVLLSPSSHLGHALTRFEEMLSLPSRATAGLRRTIERRFGENIWEGTQGSELIRDVDTPALIVHDRDDPQVPLEDSEYLVSSWPSATLITTDSLGHGRILRDENVIANAVSFIDRSRVPAGKQLQAVSR